MMDSRVGNDDACINSVANLSDVRPFNDFDDWFTTVVEEVNPELIVGIARGAIRLLQITNAERIVHDIPIVSDCALPFMHDSEIAAKKILLFDDSVIFGSTMSKIRDYLTSRGAMVFCASYIADRQNFFGESLDGQPQKPSKYVDMPIRIKNRLWPHEVRRHHDILVRILLRTPNHYNMDFPTLDMEIAKYSAGEIPYLANLLCKTKVVRTVSDVSTSASDVYSIYRYSALLNPITMDVFPEDGLHYRSYSKARLTFMPQADHVQITPIPQITMADGMRFSDVKFVDKNLLYLWRQLESPYNAKDPYYSQALFRLITSFVALVMGKEITDQIVPILQSEFPIKQIGLLKDDIRFVLGSRNV